MGLVLPTAVRSNQVVMYMYARLSDREADPTTCPEYLALLDNL